MFIKVNAWVDQAGLWLRDTYVPVEDIASIARDQNFHSPPHDGSVVCTFIQRYRGKSVITSELPEILVARIEALTNPPEFELSAAPPSPSTTPKEEVHDEA